MRFEELIEQEQKKLDESLEEASKFKMGLIGAGVSAAIYNTALALLTAGAGGAAALIGPLVIPGLIIGVGVNTIAFRQFAKGAQRTIGNDLVRSIEKRDRMLEKFIDLVEKEETNINRYKAILSRLERINSRIERLGEKLQKSITSNDGAGLFRKNMSIKDKKYFEGLIEDIADGKLVSFLPQKEVKKINAFIVEMKKRTK